METTNNIKVSLINIDDKEQSPVLKTVVQTINSYLLRNRGAAADFNLIHDIVERNCDALDEDVSQKLPVPIYLGLMGTVLGIVIGLLFLGDHIMDPHSLAKLLGGVKMAMICSFFGLLLTTVLSTYFYRGAKSKMEEQKNELYTFLQIELLPQLSKDATSTIFALQSTLNNFNQDFKGNVNGFNDIMNKILGTFDNTADMVKNLKDMDIAQIAQANVVVLKEMDNSVKEMSKFSKYMAQMNEFFINTAKLTDSVSDQLKRTEQIEDLVDAMQQHIDNNAKVMTMLNQFLARVDENKAIITASATLDNTLSESLGQLQRHVETQINLMKEYTTTATSGKLQNLDNLKKLDELDKLVAAMKDVRDSNSSANLQLSQQIAMLSKAIGGIGTGKGGGPSMKESSSPLKILVYVLVAFTCIVFLWMFFSGKFTNNISSNQQSVSENSYSAASDSTSEDTTTADTSRYIYK
jgi:biopolymer transport protein ExbB/TolQ